MSDSKTPIILRSWTIVESGRLRRRLTITESEKPETIVLSFFDPGMDGAIGRQAQSIELSREQWEALSAIGGRYDHNFNWVSQPSQGSLELPSSAPIIPANYAMAEDDI